MARKPSKSTIELIKEKELEIEQVEMKLQQLKRDLQELNSKKLQEDKDELYNLIHSAGYTKEQIEKLLISLNTRKIENKSLVNEREIDKMEKVV